MPRGSAKKHVQAFILSIPDGKLNGFPSKSGTIYKDVNFRLDLQGLTTGSAGYNLQVQVNKECQITSVAGIAPATVSHLVVGVKEQWTPALIRKALVNNITLESTANVGQQKRRK